MTDMIPIRPFSYHPPKAPLEYRHIDDDIIIVVKPSGLLSVPGKDSHLSDCLPSRVTADYPDALVVHRLDMATSGVMVMARNKAAQRHIGLQFEKRYIEKTYIARIAGAVEMTRGEINLPLICDWPNRPRQMVCHKTGKPALTRYAVLGYDNNITRIALYPKTGRSHQLRVHMHAIGHPILGDRLYAPDPVYEAADRLQLHASVIGLRHPNGGTALNFNAPVPF